jgi:hypothetical protein
MMAMAASDTQLDCADFDMIFTSASANNVRSSPWCCVRVMRENPDMTEDLSVSRRVLRTPVAR